MEEEEEVEEETEEGEEDLPPRRPPRFVTRSVPIFFALSSPSIISTFVSSKEDAGIRKVTQNWEIPALPKHSLCDSICSVPCLSQQVCLVPVRDTKQ